MNQTLPLRTDVPIHETWDLSLLFNSQQDYEVAVQQLKDAAVSFVNQYEGQLKDVNVLLEAFAAYEQLSILSDRVYAYATLAYEADKLNELNELNETNLYPLSDFVNAKLAFFQPELSELPQEVIEPVLSSEYKYYLADILRNKQHLLSKEVEEVISSLQSSLSNQYPLYLTTKFQDLRFDNFTANGKNYANSFVEFEGDYECHLDGEVRHASWASFHRGLASYQHTLAANYINHVQTEKKIATLRGFDSVIEYLLHHQKVSREAYNRQIDVIVEKFAPVMRRYAKLLAKEQGLTTISLADIKMPFSTVEAKKISIAESREMVERAFASLGEEYLEVIRRSFDERWIDFPMNQTKSTGGFCLTVYGAPSYTLLNWTGMLSEVLVLAHELGHAGHFQLSHANQLKITPEASLYFVEAPSTANEVIMCQYLLNQPIDAEQKRSLISELISRTYFHNMVTHLLEAHFQRKVYEAVDREELLNAKRLNQFFQETLELFWGDAVEINEGAELTWMRQPHYFMGLYPYTYSAGLTIGTQIGQRIAQGDADAIAKWLHVLKAGGTMGPLELAAYADVSMENGDALNAAIQYVDSLLDQLEALAQ
ncbi:oligoendopeptidase F [Aerococcaceae bacterium NML180378]|nr:oligoendopeptidase F [Aerococcaceae bacterium NML180378]